MAKRYSRYVREKLGMAIGYKGQRYEVRAFRIRSGEEVVGWTELDDGGGLVTAAQMDPMLVNWRVIDLGEDVFHREPAKGLRK